MRCDTMILIGKKNGWFSKTNSRAIQAVSYWFGFTEKSPIWTKRRNIRCIYTSWSGRRWKFDSAFAFLRQETAFLRIIEIKTHELRVTKESLTDCAKSFAMNCSDFYAQAALFTIFVLTAPFIKLQVKNALVLVCAVEISKESIFFTSF